MLTKFGNDLKSEPLVGCGCRTRALYPDRTFIKQSRFILLTAKMASTNGAMDCLRKIVPQACVGGGCSLELNEDDPRLSQIMECLSSAGLEPQARKGKPYKPNEYRMEIFRKYDHKDLARCEYFELSGIGMWEGLTHTPDEHYIELIRAKAKKGDIVRAMGYEIVVSDDAKAALESAGLRGLVFRPTVLVRSLQNRRPISWEGAGLPLRWQLTSDVRLPRVAPSVTLLDRLGDPHIEGISVGCFAHEGLYAYPELRYRASDLHALGPFDVARTHERFGPGGNREEDRAIIVSKRFYEVCREQRLKAGFVPVHLDPD